MVKRYIVILIVISAIQSCMIGKRNSYNSLRMCKVYFKNLNDTIISIDTINTIYQNKNLFFYSEDTDTFEYYGSWNLNKYKGGFLRFYSKGKVSYFVISEEINGFKRETFNPKKGKMGFYGKHKDNLLLQIARWGDGGAIISKDYLTVYKDSIVLIDKNGRGSTFVPVKVPKEYLENWEPDW